MGTWQSEGERGGQEKRRIKMKEKIKNGNLSLIQNHLFKVDAHI